MANRRFMSPGGKAPAAGFRLNFRALISQRFSLFLSNRISGWTIFCSRSALN
jgi:hypothetical protein